MSVRVCMVLLCSFAPVAATAASGHRPAWYISRPDAQGSAGERIIDHQLGQVERFLRVRSTPLLSASVWLLTLLSPSSLTNRPRLLAAASQTFPERAPTATLLPPLLQRERAAKAPIHGLPPALRVRDILPLCALRTTSAGDDSAPSRAAPPTLSPSGCLSLAETAAAMTLLNRGRSHSNCAPL
jgi:hypothetical protein